MSDRPTADRPVDDRVAGAGPSNGPPAELSEPVRAEVRQVGDLAPIDPASLPDDSPRLAEANRRITILEYALTQPGGWPARAQAVAAAIVIGGPLESLGPAPDRMTLTRWHQAWLAGDRKFAALIPGTSSGRKYRDIRGALEEHLLRQLRAKPMLLARNPRRLHLAAVEFAERASTTIPSYYAVRRWLKARRPEEIQSALYGTRAARAATAPAARHPVRRANELWFVDETLIPTWVRVFDHEKRMWVPARMWGVFVLDAHTRACLTFWLKPPKPGTPSTLLHGHATGEEVVATIAGAIVPELAHPDFRHFVRSEPGEVRLDGSGNTKRAATLLRTRARLNATLGEANAPWVRGYIERFFRTFKERELGLREDGVLGHSKVMVPFDAEAADPRTQREQNNANADRRIEYPFRHQIPLESLPEPRQIVRVVTHCIARYNDTVHQGLVHDTGEKGASPASMWARCDPPQQVVPTTLPLVFPFEERIVDKRGVQVAERWYLDERLLELYPVGDKVHIRADPLERAVWIYPARPVLKRVVSALIVERRDAYAARLSPPELVREVKRGYRERRDAQREAQQEFLKAQVGADAVADVLEDERARKRKRDRQSGRATRRGKARAEREQFHLDDEALAQHREELPGGASVDPELTGRPKDDVVVRRRQRLDTLTRPVDSAGTEGAETDDASTNHSSTRAANTPRTDLTEVGMDGPVKLEAEASSVEPAAGKETGSAGLNREGTSEVSALAPEQVPTPPRRDRRTFPPASTKAKVLDLNELRTRLQASGAGRRRGPNFAALDADLLETPVARDATTQDAPPGSPRGAGRAALARGATPDGAVERVAGSNPGGAPSGAGSSATASDDDCVASEAGPNGPGSARRTGS